MYHCNNCDNKFENPDYDIVHDGIITRNFLVCPACDSRDIEEE